MSTWARARESRLAGTGAALGVSLVLSGLAGWLIGTRGSAGLALAALIPAAMLSIWLAKRPRVALVIYLLVLSAVPVWAVEIDVRVALVPASLAALLVAPAVAMAKPTVRAADWWLLGYVCVSLVAATVFDAPKFAMGVLVAQSGSAYVVARTLGPAAGRAWTYRLLALITAAVALWACLEFVTGVHVFENFVGSSSLSFWRDIQVRGGLARSEAAFGHAIALGGFLAMGVPFVLAAGFRTHSQLLLLLLIFAGLLSTLSRGPILGALIALLFGLLFLPSSQVSRNTRLVVLAVGLFGIIAVAPRLLDFFVAVGGEETAESAKYRERLLTHWADDFNLFGQADHVTTNAAGVTLYRGFGSIDNSWLQLGLQFGWVPLVWLGVAAAACTWHVLVRRGGPAEIALVSQLFILATVAQITQYGTAVWMLAGLAVGFASRKTSDEDGRATPSWALVPGRTRPKGPVDRRAPVAPGPPAWRGPGVSPG